MVNAPSPLMLPEKPYADPEILLTFMFVAPSPSTFTYNPSPDRPVIVPAAATVKTPSPVCST